MKHCRFRVSSVQRGFTLTEVLVATAMAGILGAVAVPSYSNYTRRSHVSGGIVMAAPAQLKIAEDAIIGKSGPAKMFKPQFSMAFGSTYTPPPVSSKLVPNSSSAMVKNMFVVEDTSLVINYSPAFNSTTQYSLLMVGVVQGLSVKWTCKTGPDAQTTLTRYKAGGVDAGTAIPKEWAPSQCS
jgi:type IV pilus assembly protein PilA